MNADAYTPGDVEAAGPGASPPGRRFEALHDEARTALTDTVATLRGIRDRYLALDGSMHHPGAPNGDADEERHLALARLEVAIRRVESAWLVLERGDSPSDAQPRHHDAVTDVEIRVVAAQEAERSRLAQEVHDGPAQALANSIFQVEYLERVVESDPTLAGPELRFLRERLRRELGDVRTFISQLRPPVLAALGLNGAIGEAVAHVASVSGLEIEQALEAPADRLLEGEQTVVLRVVQEALQNARKHASASAVSVTTKIEDDAWVLEVRDTGRGFDQAAVAGRARRSFGLQFMQERAELIGAHLDVRSRPDEGTVVRLAIPMGTKESR